MSDLLEKVGLTREQLDRAVASCSLPSADSILVATARSLKGRQGRRGLPNHLVKAMYADYMRLHSLSAVGKKYGRTRQSVYCVFHERGLQLYARAWGQRINYGGRVYTPGKNGYFRATTGERREPLHHVMWKNCGNIIPAGYQVSFRDGDCTNFASDNLFCDSLAGVTLCHMRRLGKIKNLTPEEKRRRACETAKRCYQRKKVEYLARGLTTTGKVRQKRAPFLNPEERQMADKVDEANVRRTLATRENVMANYHRRADKFAAQGLTTRGQPRTYKLRGKSELQKDYDQFRAGISMTGITWDDAILSRSGRETSATTSRDETR